MTNSMKSYDSLKENLPPDSIWPSWQKNAFRFCFIFLGTVSLAAYNIIFTLFSFDWEYSVRMMKVFSGPVAWADRHFFHFGYNPVKDETFFGDSAFGWSFLFTLFFASILFTIVWSLLDRKRTNYNKFHYWFRVYLSYYLFQAMILYAIEKIIPVQMPYPNVERLLDPVGNQSGFWMVWNFIGISPAYAMFTGLSELLAALLVLSYRTRVLGSLLMTAVLANVVCLNLFYNIPVKLLCISLLVTNLFLLAPYLPRLVRFFYYLKPVSLAERRYVFSKPWKNLIMILLLLAPAWVTVMSILRSNRLTRIGVMNRKNERFYEVSRFIMGSDTLPPLMNDTLYWKRFIISAYRENKFAAIFNMADVGDYYDYDVDSIHKTITLHDNPDTSTWHLFHYSYPAPGKYSLTGKWKGQPVQVFMNAVNIDSAFLLRREKIRFY
jgi:hypothetical protein